MIIKKDIWIVMRINSFHEASVADIVYTEDDAMEQTAQLNYLDNNAVYEGPFTVEIEV
jgi:hypothetical protein